ncbi:lyase family protein [Aliagarivorans marinus]|uniref:lyase family protein n=1 Tax=Aliagarivorans marinus TaxID=561965 RepID=UPI0004283DA7|nr:lyase family protein [Aliagarivorans marinus]
MKLNKLVIASALALSSLPATLISSAPALADAHTEHAAVSVFDSRVYRDLFGTQVMRDIFSDQALVQHWIEVEVALAKAQAEMGMIPQAAYRSIKQAADEVEIDFDVMRQNTNRVGRGINPLLGQLRKAGDENVATYLHFGSTTQDIMDTATVMQIDKGIKQVRQELQQLALHLADLAEQHKATVMLSRTNGQDAIPTTFGLYLLTYMSELDRHIDRLDEVAARLTVQIGGTVGTLSAYDEQGLELQAGVAKALGFKVPEAPWNPSRDTFAEVVQTLALVNGTFGRIAIDVNNLSRTQILEVQEGEGGASSTMPQKRNPRASEFMGGLTRMASMYNSAAMDMLSHSDTRQGSPWILEWSVIPDSFMVTDQNIHRAQRLFDQLIVNQDRMLENFEASQNYVMSESVMNDLAEKIGRAQAYDVVKDAIADAAPGTHFNDVVRQTPAITDVMNEQEIAAALNPANYLGVAEQTVERAVSRLRAKRG